MKKIKIYSIKYKPILKPIQEKPKLKPQPKNKLTKENQDFINQISAVDLMKFNSFYIFFIFYKWILIIL